MNVVAHNLLAMNAQRQFNIVNGRQSKTTERLSSGYKINRAADDAAGLSISEKMRRQIRGLHQAAENIEEGIGYVQTADGALNEAHEILQRMNELAVKSANGTNTEEDREFIDCEVQQLKEELDRIFETTTFNERRIWEITGNKKQIGTEKKQAVTSSTGYTSFDVTNDNYGVLAVNSYKVNANDAGIWISWKGHDNQNYQTEVVDWDTLEANNYSFEMSDYFDKQTYGKLFDSAGKPVLKKKISFSVIESATRADIIKSLNGVYMGGSESASFAARFENADGTVKSSDVSVTALTMYYEASYASRANSANGRDFDAADDDFFEPTSTGNNPNLISKPSATDYIAARSSTEGWTFSFDIEGIGTVEASSVSLTYASGDDADDDINHWWEWKEYKSNGVTVRYKDDIDRQLGGTLGDVMDALTGAKGTNNPGLLTEQKGGGTNKGGTIDIRFEIKSTTPFSYGDTTSRNVGTFILSVNVKATDDEESVFNKIINALNENTILDFYSSSKGSDSASIGRMTAKTNKIDSPIWGGACEFFVQAGTEANQHINIIYDSLSLLSLVLVDTNVRTTDACDEAITDIKDALKTISLQRSNFGAYQNRLEHAYKSNKNVEENTTASESAIRDTDMAETMVAHANQNILLQAGQAMMAQANQSKQGILSLLS